MRTPGHHWQQATMALLTAGVLLAPVASAWAQGGPTAPAFPGANFGAQLGLPQVQILQMRLLQAYLQSEQSIYRSNRRPQQKAFLFQNLTMEFNYMRNRLTMMYL